jgi:hypothetical protein
MTEILTNEQIDCVPIPDDWHCSYFCIFCEQELEDSPTDNFWLQTGTLTIHYRCIDRLTELLAAIRANEPSKLGYIEEILE